MYADIEALVLSGELFNGKEGSSSPPRTPSPDAGWHDDELPDDEKDAQKRMQPPPEDAHESVGMGPGRTGVKGVIRDRNEAEQLSRSKRGQEMKELQNRLEKSNLGGKTYLEEEREKFGLDGEKVDELVLKERQRDSENRDLWGREREGRFGHLREVGRGGFVSAVEKEERGIWVVVHIYEPKKSLERCYHIDENLAKLARLYPNTKFVRARASALGFATSPSSSSKIATNRVGKPASRRRDEDEDDDVFDENPYSDEDEEDAFAEDNVDLDMLPTMLVYRDGELVHNWVRVDWEAGNMGIEELLDKHRILPQQPRIGSGNLGIPEDDDEDLIWSDEETGS